MPYDVYLHRTFDYQLSPTPSSIIDWAPERRMVRAVLSGSGAPAALWSRTQPNVDAWEEPLVSLEHRYRQLITQQPQQHVTGVAVDTPGLSAEIHGPSVSTNGGGLAMPSSSSPTPSTTVTPMASTDEVMTLYRSSGERAMYAAVTPEDDVFRLYQLSSAAGGPTNNRTNGSGTPMGAASTATGIVGGASSGPAAPDTSTPGSPLVGGGVSDYCGTAGLHGGNSKYAALAAHASHPHSTSPLQAQSAGWAAAVSNRQTSTAAPSWWPGWMPGGWLVGSAAAGATPLRHRQVVHLLPSSPQTVSRDSLWHSYGRVRIHQSDSLIVSAALYAAVGLNTTRTWELTRNAAPKLSTETTAPAATTATTCSDPNSDLSNAVIAYLERSSHTGSTGISGGSDGASRHRRGAAASGTHVNGGFGGVGGGAPYQQVPVHTTEQGTSVMEIGSVSKAYAARVLDVLQLEWYNPNSGRRGVFNLRLLPPTLHTRVPICEYVMQTPWTEWSLQSDELVFKWNGFLTLYQQRPALAVVAATVPSDSTAPPSASDSAPTSATTPATRASSGKKTAVPAARFDESHAGPKTTTHTAAGGEVVAPRVQPAQGKTTSADSQNTATPSAAPVVNKVEHNSNNAHAHQTSPPAIVKHSEFKADFSTPAPQQVSTSSSPTDAARVVAGGVEPMPIVRAPRPVPWWRLRELKVGAGVAVKNDLASGINMYWGLSGRTGKGLSFSGHIDVLRRMCCTCSASLGAMDASVRLRLNLVTFHKTGLDAGLLYRPLHRTHPNTAVRVACSNGKYTAGLQLHDVVHEWLRFLLPDAASGVAQDGVSFRSGSGAVRTDGTVESPLLEKGLTPAPGPSRWGAIRRTLHIGGSDQAADAAGAGASSLAAGRGQGSTVDHGSAGRGAPAASPSQQQRQAEEAAAKAAANSEGSWISAGWASATWGYITHHVGSLIGSGGGVQPPSPLPGAAHANRGGEPNSSLPHTSSSPSGAQAPMGRVRHTLHRSQTWMCGHVHQVHSGTRRVWQQVGACSSSTWRTLHRWQTRYVAPVLDSSRIDISAGVAFDNRRPNAGSWYSFVMISVH